MGYFFLEKSKIIIMLITILYLFKYHLFVNEYKNVLV